MNKKEKIELLLRAAHVLRSKISGSAEYLYEPAGAESRVVQMEGDWEYYIKIGNLHYPCSATLELWVAEYGDHGREDRSKTRFWFGLAFSSWLGIRDFVKAVPAILPVQYYGGAKSRSMVHAPRQRIPSWLSTENLDKVGIESWYGRYYLGKYFKEVLSARALPHMNRFIAFGDAILRAAELARATPTKELRKWGKKSWQEVLNRPDQANFRKRLLQAYGRCAISGYDVDGALIAAHIKPFKKSQEQELENGLLLRADLHMLFDTGLITVCGSDGKYVVKVSEKIRKSGYFKQFNGKSLMAVPKDPHDWPSTQRLLVHNKELKS